MSDYTPWSGWLWLNSWAGLSKEAVRVVGETSKRYRIEPAGDMAVRLGGPRRFCCVGETALVPRRAVSKREA